MWQRGLLSAEAHQPQAQDDTVSHVRTHPFLHHSQSCFIIMFNLYPCMQVCRHLWEAEERGIRCSRAVLRGVLWAVLLGCCEPTGAPKPLCHHLSSHRHRHHGMCMMGEDTHAMHTYGVSALLPPLHGSHDQTSSHLWQTHPCTRVSQGWVRWPYWIRYKEKTSSKNNSSSDSTWVFILVCMHTHIRAHTNNFWKASGSVCVIVIR